MATRLDHLDAMRSDLQARMSVCESDQNFAVMGRLLTDVLKQIDELGGGEKPATKKTGLSDFEKRLADRESGPKAARRSKSS